MAEYAHFSAPDPEWVQVEAGLPRSEPFDGDVDKAIKMTRDVAAPAWASVNRAIFEPQLPSVPKYTVEDYAVPVRDGEIRARVVAPVSEAGEKYPLVVYFHGGGFCAGDIGTKDYMLRFLSHELKVVTVNVEYRCDPFPRPQDDSYAALKWAVENSTKFNADPKMGFVVMGLSAGGQISAVLALRARDDPFFKDYPLSGQVLQIPGLCHPNHYPDKYENRLLSLEQNKDAPFLGKGYVIAVFDRLGGDPKDPMVSPLYASSFAGLPRTVIQVAGLDPLRDEGILYGDLLREASVETKVEIYPGVPHGFEDVCSATNAGKKFAEDMRQAILWMINNH